jgi:hypothetical protein
MVALKLLDAENSHLDGSFFEYTGLI